MKSKKIIGLTGSIATGKSTAAKLLKEMGYKVIDADKVAHDLMQKKEINYKNLVDYFGEKILDDKKEIDRNKLSKIVFSSEKELEILNKLTHGNIFHKINDIINKNDEKIVFIEIPLLIELKVKQTLPMKLDEIWLVYVSKNKQLKRLIKRNQFSEEEAKKRIASQMSVDLKKQYVDFILYNDRDLDFLEKQIRERLEKFDENIC